MYDARRNASPRYSANAEKVPRTFFLGAESKFSERFFSALSQIPLRGLGSGIISRGGLPPNPLPLDNLIPPDPVPPGQF